MKYIVRCIVVLSIFAWVGCIPKGVKPLHLVCPTPIQPDCMQSALKKAAFDTVAHPTKNYLKIIPLRTLNTDSNEWAIAVRYGGNTASVTKNSYPQIIAGVNFANPLAPEYSHINSDKRSPAAYHASFPSYSQKTSVLALLDMDKQASLGFEVNGVVGKSMAHSKNPLPQSLQYSIQWNSQPSITSNDSLLFFSSDMEGGIGGTDIWYMRWENNRWSNPINAGEQINTLCDEITPNVSADNKRLYFASNGRESAGGYDIFISSVLAAKNSISFSSAENVGKPLNTNYDEISPFFYRADNKEFLYYSSNQLSSGSSNPFDLFVLYTVSPTSKKDLKERKEIQRDADKILVNSTIKGTVFDEETQLPVESADVAAREVATAKTIAETKTDAQGKYELHVAASGDIDVIAQKNDKLYNTKRIALTKDNNGDVVDLSLTLPKTLFLRLNFPNDISNDPYNNILDDEGNETNKRWQEELDMLAENAKLYGKNTQFIAIVGHTDDKASNEYNAQLGLKRANFVKKELVKRGVPSKMLVVSSEGEDKPLPAREKPEILEDYRKRQRRVEVYRVLKTNSK